MVLIELFRACCIGSRGGMLFVGIRFKLWSSEIWLGIHHDSVYTFQIERKNRWRSP